MEQIKKSNELIDKQIKRTAYTDNHFFLFFTDDTFCVFRGCGWDERDVELMDEDFYTEPSSYNYKELHELGFITFEQKAEYATLFANQAKDEEISKELETLKKLKEKYPNT